MRINTSTLLHIDRLFFPIQRIIEFISSESKKPATDQVIAIKLKGKGSVIRFIQLCEQMNADKSKLTLITFANQRDVCEWLQIKNVLYIRSANIFHFILDSWKVYRQANKKRPRVIVSLERCSHAVNSFGLLLSLGGSGKIILFEPSQRAVSDKIIVQSAEALSLEYLFKSCINELPKTNPRNEVQRVGVNRNRIIVNINASDLLSARRYSIKSYAEIIHELYQNDSALHFVLVGSASEYSYVDQLIHLLKDVPVKNLAGQLSFRELANEFATAAFVLTGDSMALHLAAYLHAPVVALWGPTQPDHFGYSQMKNIHSVTLKLQCSPCFIHPASKPAEYCKGRIDCLSQITSHQVVEVCKEVLLNNSVDRQVNFPAGIDIASKEPKFCL